MKKKLIIFFMLINAFIYANEYINVSEKTTLRNGQIITTLQHYLFDDRGFLKEYESQKKYGSKTIVKKVKGSFIKDKYILYFYVRNDFTSSEPNFDFSIEFIKSEDGWNEYYNNELLTVSKIDLHNSCIVQHNNRTHADECLYKKVNNSFMLYNSEYKLCNGIYTKKNLNTEFGEKIIGEKKSSNSITYIHSFEGDLFEYNIDYNYYFRNYDQIILLYRLQNFDVSSVYIPLLMINEKMIYHSTSYLTEGSTTYEPEHLQQKDGLPWASGNGFGIGDVISIKEFEHKNPTTLKIMNGYQNPNHPDYYEKNSRVKTLQVPHADTQKSKKLTVQDIKTEQTFDISALGNGRTFEVEILDVYGGSKYKDLCIQYLVFE